VPSGLEAFTEHVIPLMRKCGAFRTEYTGRTLREHYGIPRPDNQFTATGRAGGRGVILPCCLDGIVSMSDN
jgi:N-acetyl-S-(2-succino)cysteine monooxygenase